MIYLYDRLYCPLSTVTLTYLFIVFHHISKATMVALWNKLFLIHKTDFLISALPQVIYIE